MTLEPDDFGLGPDIHGYPLTREPQYDEMGIPLGSGRDANGNPPSTAYFPAGTPDLHPRLTPYADRIRWITLSARR